MTLLELETAIKTNQLQDAQLTIININGNALVFFKRNNQIKEYFYNDFRKVKRELKPLCFNVDLMNFAKQI